MADTGLIHIKYRKENFAEPRSPSIFWKERLTVINHHFLSLNTTPRQCHLNTQSLNQRHQMRAVAMCEQSSEQSVRLKCGRELLARPSRHHPLARSSFIIKARYAGVSNTWEQGAPGVSLGVSSWRAQGRNICHHARGHPHFTGRGELAPSQSGDDVPKSL